MSSARLNRVHLLNFLQPHAFSYLYWNVVLLFFSSFKQLCLLNLFCHILHYLATCMRVHTPPVACASGNEQIAPFYGWVAAGDLKRSRFLLNCFVQLQQSDPWAGLRADLMAATCRQHLAPSLRGGGVLRCGGLWLQRAELCAKSHRNPL